MACCFSSSLFRRRQRDIVASALFDSAVSGNTVGREEEGEAPSDFTEPTHTDLFTILENGDDVNPLVSFTMTS